jgi:ABC-2 type transport system ATP-binding protein
VSTPTIRLERVAKRYGRRRVLHDVELRVGAGVTGLLGPNGAGKTTLLRIVATVLAPDAGTVSVAGATTATADGRQAIRRGLGYLPQEVGFHKHFTAFELLDYLAILKELTERRERHDEVRRVLDVVGLGGEAHRRIRALSGGMRRRLGVAQALLGDPAVVVLDEPTVGLDPEQRLRFRELISGLAEGRTVLLSTHQTDDVEALCQRVVVLADGEIPFDGTPDALTAVAEGRVWVDERRHPDAQVAWRSGDGRFRNLGSAPAGATLAEPTIEDGYLTLLGTGELAGAA